MLDVKILRDGLMRLRCIGGGDSEREQAMIRVGIGSLLLIYYAVIPMHSEHQARVPEPASLVLLFLLTVLLLQHVLVYPGDKPWRRLAGAVMDVFSVTYFFFTSDAAAVPMYALYLWVIFGNGFRYGQRYLFFSLALSLLGFGFAMYRLPEWRSHPSLAWGLWMGMLAVSLYVSLLMRRLRKTLEIAQAANMAKRRFVSSVSHELRTPLNAIIGMGTLLRMTQLDHDQQDMLASLEDASRLMLTLIEDVLDFSKIEAGKVSLEVVSFNLEDLIKSAVGLLRFQALGKGLELHCRVPAELPCAIQGDQHHLKQILVNLLSNAIKFTHAGEVDCSVTRLHGDAQCLWLRFEVNDTGIGIPLPAQARIFESFAQANDSTTRRYGGTGLGTTIAKQLVELMGGRIGLVSTPGKGSLFWFELPFVCQHGVQDQPGHAPAHASATHAQSQAAVPAAVPAGPLARTLRVLVAEDNPTNAKLLQRMLERFGHSFELVTDGEQALDRLTSSQFDIALFDMNMPVLSGLDALKAYRYMAPRDQRVPIAIFSADASVDTREECLRAGADAYLTKPVHLNKLLSTMGELTGTDAGSGSRPAVAKRPTAGLAPAAASPVPDSSPQFDLSALEELEALGGSSEFVHTLIDGYIEDNRKLLERLAAGIERQRLQECRDALHAMKGSAVSIGAIGMRRFCDETERMEPQEFFRLRHSIVERCNSVLDALCRELQQLRASDEIRIKNDGNSGSAARST
jgi:two-component system sensor histidine kinase RpfC